MERGPGGEANPPNTKGPPHAPRPKSPSPARRAQHAAAARQMRRDPTPAERVLWLRLRNRQVAGAKFRRQQSIDRFVVDFYCAEARLVIEIDGPVHDSQTGQDAERQAILESLGLRVLRISNEAVCTSPDGVIAHIADAVQPG
ncbi:MAG: endonuclease domain-containing protein [Anaerolineae bacterium]|nr:endonuclease domain-containing protein [Anaerolineae bacterium]